MEEKKQNTTIDVNILLSYKEQFERQALFGRNRKERIEMLMQRRSAKKWPAHKKQRMVRRHLAAQQQTSSAQKMIDNINLQLFDVEAKQ